MNKPKLWTKDFVVICMVNLFAGLSFYLLLTIVSVYAMDTFQVSPSAAGLASSIFVIGAITTRLFFGRLIERIGRRRMLYAGLILNAAIMALYFVINSFTLLIIIRFLHGAAFGIVSMIASTIVANIIPLERRGEGMAYYISLSATIAAALGPFLGMFIIQHGSYNVMFLVCTIVTASSILIAFILTVPEIKLTEAQLQETREFKFNRIFATKAIPIAIVCAGIYFCYSSVITFLSAFSKEANLISAASFFFVVFSIVILISRPFVGRLFDAKGENIIMYPAILIFAIGIFVLSRSYNGYTLLLAGALVGLGLGSIQTSGSTIAIQMVPRHQTGLANSTFLSFLDAGVGIGPFIFGAFIPSFGYRGVYIGVSIVVVACLLLYYVLHGGKAMRERAVDRSKA